MPPSRPTMLLRLDARDRALYDRLALADGASPSTLRLWTAVTHLGGARSAIAAVLIPLLFAEGALHRAAVLGAWTLLVSHLIVQMVKRTIGRPRPMPAREGRSLVEVPDRFSFPSGHSAAAMSVAFAYGIAVPSLVVPMTIGVMVIGMSRVRLGVHYPGDVLAGQLIAIATAMAFWLAV